MPVHLFSVGERVSLESIMRRTADRADVFVVKTQMPHLGEELQYRVKTEGEPYDRVVTEGQLTRVAIAAAV
ncbi:hypothetical protein [Lichenibacterium ramalinae]|uniref:Uncharacterized protein n=1 Tax=Lichenibacterium ramalinae TaxID=2316527 RepID=A0A4Q2RHD7_9HYPH|nr:hypothetical protein [Lichenibacterium ramalinae]RYB07908.1 hypothetical protein D3272_01985 [Lichenibacterium ramalinae]